MAEPGKRVEVRFGAFTCSIEGYDNPVEQMRDIIGLMQKMISETPALTESADFNAAEMQEALNRGADDEPQPGVVIIRQNEDGSPADSDAAAREDVADTADVEDADWSTAPDVASAAAAPDSELHSDSDAQSDEPHIEEAMGADPDANEHAVEPAPEIMAAADPSFADDTVAGSAEEAPTDDDEIVPSPAEELVAAEQGDSAEEDVLTDPSTVGDEDPSEPAGHASLTAAAVAAMAAGSAVAFGSDQSEEAATDAAETFATEASAAEEAAPAVELAAEEVWADETAAMEAVTDAVASEAAPIVDVAETDDGVTLSDTAATEHEEAAFNMFASEAPEPVGDVHVDDTVVESDSVEDTQATEPAAATAEVAEAVDDTDSVPFNIFASESDVSADPIPPAEPDEAEPDVQSIFADESPVSDQPVPVEDVTPVESVEEAAPAANIFESGVPAESSADHAEDAAGQDQPREAAFIAPDPDSAVTPDVGAVTDPWVENAAVEPPEDEPKDAFNMFSAPESDDTPSGEYPAQDPDVGSSAQPEGQREFRPLFERRESAAPQAPVEEPTIVAPTAPPAAVEPRSDFTNLLRRVHGTDMVGGPGETAHEDPAQPPDRTGISAADLAARSSSETVADLLSAAAAWLTICKGETRFTRRQVMEVFDQMPGDHPRTLEARIKGYGKLVRSGTLVLIDDGVFAMTQTERDRFAEIADQL